MKAIKIDVEDEKYPQRLLNIKDFPTEIYAMGDIKLLNVKHTIGIVGSRKCTEYGSRVTNEFAKKLSEEGVCVISGMAVGIDGIAHNAAIEGKGKTIAVLCSGFSYIYPPENEWLFYKILDKGGCIISEYPPKTEPDSKKFPTRNRIISGLSDAVLVVEATHRSGSTITAKYAKEEGKKVFAIPNTIYATTGVGTNRLLREGAILAISPMQIYEENKQENLSEINKKRTGEDLVKSKRSKKGRGNLKKISKDEIEMLEKNKEQIDITKKNKEEIMPKEYIQVYRILSDKPIHINELAKKLNRPIQVISPIITLMEIEGYAYQPQSNYFIRL